MYTNRVRQALAATLNGLPLSLTVEEFQPPEIELEMEEMKGGRFVGEEMAKGGKALTMKITLQGTGSEVAQAIGGTKDILLSARESGKDQDEETWCTTHEVQGKLKSLKDKAVKMGDKPQTDLEIAIRTYKRKENGTLVTDIDVRTQKIMVNGEDIVADARRAIGL